MLFQIAFRFGREHDSQYVSLRDVVLIRNNAVYLWVGEESPNGWAKIGKGYITVTENTKIYDFPPILLKLKEDEPESMVLTEIPPDMWMVGANMVKDKNKELVIWLEDKTLPLVFEAPIPFHLGWVLPWPRNIPKAKLKKSQQPMPQQQQLKNGNIKS